MKGPLWARHGLKSQQASREQPVENSSPRHPGNETGKVKIVGMFCIKAGCLVSCPEQTASPYYLEIFALNLPENRTDIRRVRA